MKSIRRVMLAVSGAGALAVGVLAIPTGAGAGTLTHGAGEGGRGVAAAGAVTSLALLPDGSTAATVVQRTSTGAATARDVSFSAVKTTRCNGESRGGITPRGARGSVQPQGRLGDMGSTTSPFTGRAYSTAVTPDGSLGLVPTDDDDVQTVEQPASAAPTVGPEIGLGAFTGEGGSGYCTFTFGVAIAPDGKSALVATDSQGAIQLLRQGDTFVVDKRVHSSGLNNAGTPHLPGWIKAPGSSTLYNAVTISPVRASDGTYNALLFDGENDGTTDPPGIAVVVGVGGPSAHVSAVLHGSTLDNGSAIAGQGSMAFLPGSATRAVVLTHSGFAVLDISNPASPRLLAATTPSATSEPTSVAVLPDGQHVAVGEANQLYFYGGLGSAASAALSPSASPLTFGTSTDVITSVEASPDGALEVFYRDDAAPGGEFEATVTGAETGAPAHKSADDLAAGSGETVFNGTSLWPALTGAGGAPSYGYFTASVDGQVAASGDEKVAGDPAASDIRGVAATPGHGYWLVGADGGVFTYGDAVFRGSLPQRGIKPGAPIVSVIPTPDYLGYWVVGADGGVFTFGDARFKGSLPSRGIVANGPITAAAATPDGGGYWLVGSNGAVYSFGDAHYLGSLTGRGINPGAGGVTGFATNASGTGYWLASATGGVYTFGQARFEGATYTPKLPGVGMISGMAAIPSDEGYWLSGGDGVVVPLGSIPQSSGGLVPTAPVAGIAAG